MILTADSKNFVKFEDHDFKDQAEYELVCHYLDHLDHEIREEHIHDLIEDWLDQRRKELTPELKKMAAYNYGWIQALLHSFKKHSFDELIKRPEIRNLIVSEDEGVIDINVGDAIHGFIATSIRTVQIIYDPEPDGWELDRCFDIYNKDNDLVTENMTFEALMEGE